MTKEQERDELHRTIGRNEKGQFCLKSELSQVVILAGCRTDHSNILNFKFLKRVIYLNQPENQPMFSNTFKLKKNVHLNCHKGNILLSYIKMLFYDNEELLNC